MIQKLTTMEIRKRLGDILNRVALRHDHFIIERRGKPMAAMVPVAVLQQMRKAARLHLLDVLQRQPGEMTQEEADELANEAKHWSRR